MESATFCTTLTYQGRSNNYETRFGVSGDIVDNLTSTLLENENY